MDPKPLVTVYIPTHNRVELLRRAVCSVLEQDYGHIELIIVDDCSTDGTAEYLQQLEQADRRVKALRNHDNRGACYSRNRALQRAGGAFVTGLDDDDYFLPTRISNFVNAWKNKGVRTIALYSNQLVIKANGSQHITRRRRQVKQDDLLDRNDIGNQIFTRPETILDAGGFDENVQSWQDYELWFRLLSRKDTHMRRIDTIDYVLDMSHPHERISGSAPEKRFHALEVIARKNRLSRMQYEAMKIQCCNSTMMKPPFSALMRKLFFRPNLVNTEMIIKIIVKSLYHRWPSWRSVVGPQHRWYSRPE